MTRTRFVADASKLIVLAGVLWAVAFATHETGAVAGAFAALVAALYYRQPAGRCLRR